MKLTPTAVEREHEWVRGRADVVVPVLNDVRASLGAAFGADVAGVTTATYREEVDVVFADGDRAVNVAALVAVFRDLAAALAAGFQTWLPDWSWTEQESPFGVSRD